MPTNTPRRIANVWVDYAFLPDWTASAAARYVGKTYADAANTTWAPAYMVRRRRLAPHRPEPHRDRRVRNLTDKVCGQRQQRRHVLPGARAFELTLQARY